MKKRYVEPLMEAMEIESEGMLCVSGGMSENPASTPALAPYYEWEDEE